MRGPQRRALAVQGRSPQKVVANRPVAARAHNVVGGDLERSLKAMRSSKTESRRANHLSSNTFRRERIAYSVALQYELEVSFFSLVLPRRADHPSRCVRSRKRLHHLTSLPDAVFIRFVETFRSRVALRDDENQTIVAVLISSAVNRPSVPFRILASNMVRIVL